MFVRLFFYDIKIKVYVVLRKRRRKKNTKSGEEEKHLGRRLVDNVINDYNIEMIDIPTI